MKSFQEIRESQIELWKEQKPCRLELRCSKFIPLTCYYFLYLTFNVHYKYIGIQHLLKLCQWKS